MKKGKLDYKVFIYLILGGFIGFFSVNGIDNGMVDGLLEWIIGAKLGIIHSLLITVIILMIVTVILLTRLLKLNGQKFSGDEEDAIEIIKYKKSSDYSMLVMANLIIALSTFSFSLLLNIEEYSFLINIGSPVILIIAVIVSLTPYWLIKKLDPQREIPSVFEKEAAEKLIKIMDEGEKHVTFQGLYKAYNLLSIVMIISILVSTVYSKASGQSQAFSIGIMAFALIISNITYYRTIRKKY